MRSYKKFTVCQKAHELALEIYRTTEMFPKQEQFGLISQMRRAAVSVPANVAEGCGHGTDVEFARFLQISTGSLNELDYHVVLARDLGYLPESHSAAIGDRREEIRKMLAGLTRKLTADG